MDVGADRLVDNCLLLKPTNFKAYILDRRLDNMIHSPFTSDLFLLLNKQFEMTTHALTKHSKLELLAMSCTESRSRCRFPIDNHLAVKSNDTTIGLGFMMQDYVYYM